MNNNHYGEGIEDPEEMKLHEGLPKVFDFYPNGKDFKLPEVPAQELEKSIRETIDKLKTK